MNNIEILENMLKVNRLNKRGNREIKLEVNSNYYKAIENLIQENKELKEHLQKYYNGELFTAKQLKSIEENQKKYFIHKSKLKEKIEEIEKRKQDLLQLPDDCARTLGLEDCDEKIILYKELLVEGE